MHRLAFLAVSSLLALTSSPSAQAQTEPADPHGMRVWQLAMLKRGPNYASLKGEARAKIFKGHFANMRRLTRLGSWNCTVNTRRISPAYAS